MSADTTPWGSGSRRTLASRVGDTAVRVAGVHPGSLLQAGDDEPLTADRTRYVVMGVSVCITACLAVISMTLAVSIIIGKLHPVAVAVGAVWGLFVFNVDRWIVSSFDFGTGAARVWRQAGLTAVRLLVAVLVAVSISEPLLMWFFHGEITAQLNIEKDVQQQAATDRLRALPEYQLDATDEWRTLAVAQGGLDGAWAWERDVDAKLTEAERAGSSAARVDELRRERDDARRQIDIANQDLIARRSALDARAATLTSALDSRIASDTTSIDERYTNSPGLIDREKALAALGHAEPVVLVTTWFLRGLLLLIDLTPALLKMVAPPTLHEEMQRQRARRLRTDHATRLEEALEDAAYRRSIRRASERYAWDLKAKLDDESITRNSDLEYRALVADHLDEVARQGYTASADAGVLSFAPRNRHRAHGGGVGGREPGGPHAPSGNGEQLTRDVYAAAEDDPIVVNARWRTGRALSTPSQREPWRVAFHAQSTDPTDPHDYALKRVMRAFDNEKSDDDDVAAWGYALREMHQFPQRTEISEHVAPMIDAGYDPEFGGYIVTPLYHAGTLDQYVASTPIAALTLREVVNFGEEILQGLSVVFTRHRLMHFDIKPSNIAMDNGHVRIIDWGLAAARSAVGEPPHGFSQWYAPPEQRNAHGPNRNWRSPACDIRALGATMYHLITGRPPLWLEASQRGLLGADGDIEEDRVTDFVTMLAHEEPAPLDVFFALDDRWNHEQLRGLSELVSQWLHPDPHQRVAVRGATEDAYRLARHDLIEVTTALTRRAASDLDRHVGRAAFPSAPTILGHNGVRMAQPSAGTQSTVTGSVSR